MENNHWADKFVDELLKVPVEREHVICTGITPSGEIHIGNMREMITADAIYRVLKERGIKSKFLYVADNFDPLRRVYPFLDSTKYEAFVGHPLSEIPCPCEKHVNYSMHFLEPFCEALKTLKIDVEIIYADQLYKMEHYTSGVLTALKQTAIIAKIIEEETGRKIPEGWSPFMPLCNKCHRIVDTVMIGFSETTQTVDYNCGCGYTGTTLIAGGGKLTWRVDWPARWKFLNITEEPFGKDHATPGGSYSTGKRIAREVFNIQPPQPLIYEWISLKGGGDMSSSKGNVLSIQQMLEVVPPEILRYMILKTQPQKSIVIDPTIPLLNLVDEYDNLEAEGRDLRSIRLSETGDFKPVGIPFKHIVNIIQIARGDFNLAIHILKRNNYRIDDENALKSRMGYAKRWLQDFAPDVLKFAVSDDIPPDAKGLGNIQKRVLEMLAEKLTIQMSAEEIHQTIYGVKEEVDIPIQPVFEAIYLALLGQKKGPRAGWFISILGIEWVKKRFCEVAI